MNPDEFGQEVSRYDFLVITTVWTAILTVYLLFYEFPAHRGGLYLMMAERIVANSFLLPQSVVGYTTIRLPFAYPPLGLYLMALPIAIGVPELLVLRVLPGITFVLASYAVYLFVVNHTNDRRYALAAAVFTLVCPQILYQSVVGAGVTRSLGLAFLLLGLVWVEDSFESPAFQRNRIAVAGFFFGACLLTHYIYALLFGIATITKFVLARRTTNGLVRGMAIAGVGFVVASPWVAVVSIRNGFGTLLNPSSSYMGGLAPVPWLAAVKLLEQPVSPVGYLFTAGAVIGGGYLLLKGKPFLPAVAAIYTLVYPHLPSQYALFAILTGVATVEIARHGTQLSRFSWRGFQYTPNVGLAVLLIGAVGLGGVFVADIDGGIGSPPSTLDDESMQTMQWAAENTRPDATFLIPSQMGEWFPAIAHRRAAVTKWGTEWVARDVREYHMRTMTAAGQCSAPSCFDSVIADMETTPDYLVIDKDQLPRAIADHRVDQFEASPTFRVVYVNSEYIVVEVRDDRTTSQSRTGTRTGSERPTGELSDEAVWRRPR